MVTVFNTDFVFPRNTNAERKGFNFVVLHIIAVICWLKKNKTVLYVPLGIVKNMAFIFLHKELGF